MKRLVHRMALLGLLIVLSSCGSKKSPTGGPEDKDRPVVLTTLPAQFAQLTDGRIEINLSKALDKNSIAQAVYIHPPVNSKKFSVDKNTLVIRLYDELLPDTNYNVILTTRIKDIRGNSLAENQTLVFAHGKLNKLRVSGTIDSEDTSDIGKPVSLSLLTQDSLLVRQQTVQGASYALEALNPASYILRAYIDKDANGRYDFARDPWFEGSLNLRSNSNLNLSLAYADTSKPVLRSVLARSKTDIELSFSETVAGYQNLRIIAADGAAELPVLLSKLQGPKLTLVTGRQASSAYVAELTGVRDLKGNVQERTSLGFTGSSIEDTSTPRVIATIPRNGASVSDLQPILEIQFSELIPRANLSAILVPAESSGEVPLDILFGDSDVYRFKPRQPLQNYRSYVLEINATDINGNKLIGGYKLSFLPLQRR